MNNSYKDIRERIAEEPTWYDANGVPRYGKFTVDGCPSIYASEISLYEIECQYCGAAFMVEDHYSVMDRVTNQFAKPLSKQIKSLHYGDPPAHGCVGDSMNCEDIRVIEFWKQEDFIWRRVPELEINLGSRGNE